MVAVPMHGWSSVQPVWQSQGYVQLVTITAAAPRGPATTVDSRRTKVSRLRRSFLRFFFIGLLPVEGGDDESSVVGCGGPSSPGNGYFFLMSLGTLTGAALLTAVFLGFLVSFFRALLPLAMVPSGCLPSIWYLTEDSTRA